MSAGATSRRSNPLEGLHEIIRTHWREHRPQMCAVLEAESRFDKAVDQAVRNTEDAVHRLVDLGESLWDAWISVREMWAILPAEEEEDELATEYPDMFLGPTDDEEEEGVVQMGAETSPEEGALVSTTPR